MNKFLLGIQGYISCVGWILPALWEWLLESCPDIRFWNWHNNFDDHIWYAERVNGRLAMLAWAFLLIWCLTHGIQFDEILLRLR